MLGIGRLQGILSILGLGLFVLMTSLKGWSPSLLHVTTMALASGLITLGGILFPFNRQQAQFLSSSGFLGVFITTLPLWSQSPALFLLLSVITLGTLFLVWNGVDPDGSQQTHRTRIQVILRSTGAVHTACICSLILWFLVVVDKLGTTLFSYGAVLSSFIISLALLIQWIRREKRRFKLNALLTLGICLVAGVGAVLLGSDRSLSMTFMALIPASGLILVRKPTLPTLKMAPAAEPFFFHPERVLISTFFILSFIGTIILSLPVSSSHGVRLNLIDAAFTAVSAVCVTGLNTLNPAVDLSRAGQAFTLLLIQVGGLGIMTFSTATLIILGRRLSLRHEGAVAKMLGGEHRGEMLQALKRMLWVTFASELIGTALLSFFFVKTGDPLSQAIWRGLFTSISAFCNAGFALQPENLIPYQNNPGVLHTVGTLIVIGGLSPSAILALPRLIRGKPVSIHIKIVLGMSAILLLMGTAVLAATEWKHSLAHLSAWDRIHNAWFQSVTTRTAGFNSIQLTALQPASILFMVLLMFVGGSPGGTAGGLKTTTFSVILLSLITTFRGQSRIQIFGRMIPHETIYKAMAILTAGGVIGTISLLALQLTQSLPNEVAIFEVVSALGTVGLSLDATPKLDGIGKAIIMFCMFAGRVGPLSIFLFLANYRPQPSWKVPEEPIVLG